LQGFDGLAETIQADVLIADKGYDADKRVRAVLAAAGKTAVIPPRRNRKSPACYDKELYKKRHRIENFFSRLKDFRAIATRYEKSARNFLAGIYLAAAIIWLD
jgi:transposase